MTEDDLAVFEPYLVSDYVLVIAWISSIEEIKEKFPKYSAGVGDLVHERWSCLYVEFDTEKASYPMNPTSAYGETEIPVDLCVVGYNAPECDDALKRHLRVNYYQQDTSIENAEVLGELPERDFPYTTVSLRARASAFTSDLWFVPRSKPFSFVCAGFLDRIFGATYALVIFIILDFALVSYLRAGLSALILFRK